MFVFLKHGKQFFSMYMLIDLQTRDIFPYLYKNEIYKLMTCVLLLFLYSKVYCFMEGPKHHYIFICPDKEYFKRLSQINTTEAKTRMSPSVWCPCHHVETAICITWGLLSAAESKGHPSEMFVSQSLTLCV